MARGPYGAGSRPPRRRMATVVGGSSKGQSQGCCSMAAAGRAARRGKFKLAARYARMSVRLIIARIA